MRERADARAERQDARRVRRRFLVITALTLGTLALCGTAARANETGNLDELRTLALMLVNQERHQRNLPPLDLDTKLDAAAQMHAEDMLTRDYYAHVSPEGESVMDRYIEAGGSRWHLVQENIARCTGCPPPSRAEVERLHKGWMNSQEHRENILEPGVSRFGFGVVAGRDNRLYAVQTFAGAGLTRGTARRNDENRTLSPAEQTSGALELINGDRRKAGVPPLEASDVLARAANGVARRELDDNSGGPTSAAVLDELSSSDQMDWRSLSVVAGICGGCGHLPVLADLTFFRDQWLNKPPYRETLLTSTLTHFGMALRADGEGRKVAVAVLGRHR